jgi:flavin-dependent dehydrogenase
MKPGEGSHRLDAIVVGGGPAGSAAATILAQHGRRVAVLERRRFPRYRLGESLIPYCWFPLDRMGVLEKIKRSACVVEKRSVQFVTTDGEVAAPFYFDEHTDHDCARTWQVVRSDFDRILLEHAVEAGAEIRMETIADELIREDGAVVGVRVRRPDGRAEELRAPMTIDASGRELFAASRSGWPVKDPKLTKIAVWTYYRGARRDAGRDAGATTIAYLPDKGWFWYIPLPEDVVSVGVVAERAYLYRGARDPEAIFRREVEQQPWVRHRLETGRRIERCRVTGDYSYRSRHCAADGLLLTGDAFAFLDPVFSSGVFLALECGVLAGDAVEAALAGGDCSAVRFETYGRRCCQAIEAMRRLVHAFYDTTFSFAAFLREHPHLRDDLTDCLIGNVFKDLEPLFAAASRHADIPEPLAYGGPLVGRGAEPSPPERTAPVQPESEDDRAATR